MATNESMESSDHNCHGTLASKVVGDGRPPLVLSRRVESVIARSVRCIHQVTIRIMLKQNVKWIAPIIKDLGPKNMSTQSLQLKFEANKPNQR